MWQKRSKGASILLSKEYKIDERPIEERNREMGIYPDELARFFCEMDDEQQAEFFIACARHAKEWDFSAHGQWFAVGRHLKECDCSNDSARDMVKCLNLGLL